MNDLLTLAEGVSGAFKCTVGILMRNGTSDLQIWHFVRCLTKGVHHSEESEGLKFSFPLGISFFLCLEKTKSSFM